MSEQTEGPWYTYHTFEPRRILILRMNGEPGGTPLEWQRKLIYPPVAVVIGHNKTDANILAAAPELLAACETFLDVWDRTGQMVKTDVAVRMMRIAIDKAHGEATP